MATLARMTSPAPVPLFEELRHRCAKDCAIFFFRPRATGSGRSDCAVVILKHQTVSTRKFIVRNAREILVPEACSATQQLRPQDQFDQ